MRITSLRFHLRDATAEDADDIAALHLASWRSAYRGIVSDEFLDHAAPNNRLALWRGRLSSENIRAHRARVAIDGNALLGFACISTDPHPAWGFLLDNLHVHPHQKGRGIGHALIADAAGWASRQKLGTPMHLWVFAQNRPACDFYERLSGVADGHTAGRAPDGSDVESVRYLWRDPTALARR